MRETINGYNKVIAEIDQALKVRQTQEEALLLNSIKENRKELHAQSLKTLKQLYDGVGVS